MKSGEKDSKVKLFKITDRLKSFRYAFSGIADLLKYQHNARIHSAVFFLVLLAGVLFRISSSDWIAIILASGLVFASEAFNTSIEYLSDAVSLEQNEKIRRAKDVAAAGVLISAFISVVIGLLVFLPAIFRFFACTTCI
jgi:diacylglycerol kinase (ATP)